MTPEITELIKNKAEAYIKDSTIDEKFLTNSEYDSIVSDYSVGQIEAIEMMIGFMLWADDNYWRLGNKDEWVYEIGEDDSPVFTSIELLTKYIKEINQPN